MYLKLIIKFNFPIIIKLPNFVNLKLVFISIVHFNLLDQFLIVIIFHFIIYYNLNLQVPHFFVTIILFLNELNLFIIIIYYFKFNYFLLIFHFNYFKLLIHLFSIKFVINQLKIPKLFLFIILFIIDLFVNIYPIFVTYKLILFLNLLFLILIIN